MRTKKYASEKTGGSYNYQPKKSPAAGKKSNAPQQKKQRGKKGY